MPTHALWLKAAVTAVAALAVLLGGRRSLGLSFALAVAAATLANGSLSGMKELFLTARWGALAALAVVAVRAAAPEVTAEGLLRLAPLAALPGFALISAAWSTDPRLTIERSLAFGVLLLSAAALALGWRRRPDGLGELLDWLAVLTVVVVGVSAILAFASTRGVLAGQARGLLENPNGLGIFAALGYPAVAAWLDRRGLTLMQPLVVLLALATTVVSHSRSGALGLVVGLLVYEAAMRRRHTRALAAVVVVAAVSVVVVAALGFNLPYHTAKPAPIQGVLSSPAPNIVGGSIGSGETFALRLTGARSEAWSAAADLIARRPGLGYGFGTGDKLFAAHPEVATFLHFQGDNPNDAYLQLALELGIVGAALFALVILLAAARQTVAVTELASTPERSALSAILVAALAIAVVESTFTSAGAPWEYFLWVPVAGGLDARGIPLAAPADSSLRASMRLQGPVRALRLNRRRLAIGLLAAAVAAVGLAWISHRPHQTPIVRASAAAASLARRTCGNEGCVTRTLTRLQSSVWWVRLSGGSGRCYVLDLDLYSQRNDGVLPVTCGTLPVARRHVLTVGVLDSGPPYFTPPATDPGGLEGVLGRELAHELHLGLVEWAAARAAVPTKRMDFVVHVFEHTTHLPPNYLPYVSLPLDLLAQRGSPAAGVRTVAAARFLRIAVGSGDDARTVRQVVGSGTRTTVAQLDSLAGEVEGKHADAVALPEYEVPAFLAEHGGFVVVGALPANRFYGIRFRAGSRLEPLVRTVLAHMTADGTLEQIRRETLHGPAPARPLR